MLHDQNIDLYFVNQFAHSQGCFCNLKLFTITKDYYQLNIYFQECVMQNVVLQITYSDFFYNSTTCFLKLVAEAIIKHKCHMFVCMKHAEKLHFERLDPLDLITQTQKHCVKQRKFLNINNKGQVAYIISNCGLLAHQNFVFLFELFTFILW